MSQPPPLPKRNVAQDRSQNAVPVPTSQPKRVVDAPPELPSRKQVPAPDVLSATAGGEASDQTAYPKAMKEPTARRFVAPIPVPSTPPQSTITSTFRAWLDLLPSRRPDTPEEANIRRKLEEQQIARYMNSFSKHVQYLRMDSGYATQRSIQDGAGRLQRKPDLDDFRSAPLGDKDKIEAVGLETSDTDQRQSSQAGPGAVEAPIDWFGYYAAVCPMHRRPIRSKSHVISVKLAVYHLHCYFPSLASNNIQPLHLTSKSIEREPFTVSRLRSSVERLLVNARSPWQKTFVTIGQVAMWHDVAKSLKWLFVSTHGFLQADTDEDAAFIRKDLYTFDHHFNLHAILPVYPTLSFIIRTPFPALCIRFATARGGCSQAKRGRSRIGRGYRSTGREQRINSWRAGRRLPNRCH